MCLVSLHPSVITRPLGREPHAPPPGVGFCLCGAGGFLASVRVLVFLRPYLITPPCAPWGPLLAFSRSSVCEISVAVSARSMGCMCRAGSRW